MDCKYIAVIDGKTYTYTNASQVFILEDAISIGVDEEILEKFVNKVYDLYISDSNDTPLDKLIGLAKDYDGSLKNIYEGIWGKWKLNTYYKESLTLAKCLTKAGFIVELFYKEAKK